MLVIAIIAEFTWVTFHFSNQNDPLQKLLFYFETVIIGKCKLTDLTTLQVNAMQELFASRVIHLWAST